MTIYIDSSSPPPSGPSSPTGSLMTSSLNGNLETALTSLRAKLPDIEGAITGNVIVTTFREGFPSTSIPTTGVYFHWAGSLAGYEDWYSNLEEYLSRKSIPYNKSMDTVILMMPGEIGALELGSYKTPDIGGLPNVDFNHQRFLFHELMHVVTLYDESIYNAYTKGNSPTVAPWEADTIAIAGENILYAQATPGAGLAGGHGGSADAGFSGINTFLELSGEAEVNQTTVDGATAFVFSESDGGLTTRKIIFERGVDPEGADEIKLNHYILNEIESEDNLIEADGSLTALLGTAVASGNSDSASSNLADKVQKTRETLDDIQDFADTRPLKFIPQNVNAVLDALPQLDQSRARMLSLETSSVRLSTVVEVQGPQKADETTGSNNGSATYLSIAAGGSAALLVGGAGFNDRNVDFSNRLDDLYGSDEDDFIVGGDGLASGDDR